MDSSVWFDTIKLGMGYCIYQGVSGYTLQKKNILVNSVDSDEMVDCTYMTL